ncbi:MAG: hypothetical protein OXR62_16155 [Ahrensia sp.]|nr:hypothetical protein [Ahrensia sp.]
MNMHFEPKEMEAVAQARDSFSGRLLTDAQFNDFVAVSGILESEIRQTGTFKEKLTDYSHALARTSNMDAMKAETTLRDIFRARTGQTMNQLREELIENEEKLPEEARDYAREMVKQTGEAIKHGDKMPFYRAYDHHAGEMAQEFNITNVGARRVMNEVFREERDSELRDWGKELEEKYYRPQIEAEKQERQSQSRSKPGRSRSRTRQPA